MTPLPPVFAPAPPWLLVAFPELGVNEQDDPDRIRFYHEHTRSGGAPPTVPWCSSGLCYVFEMAGLPSTKSKEAGSWLSWGIELAAPVLGCVTVFNRLVKDAGGTGHVGLHLGGVHRTLITLGFNQGDAVRVREYWRSDARSYRWPEAYPLPPGAVRK